jgi:hypothetical protein
MEMTDMSRYTFAGHRPELSIVVGWDNPLRTYFAQVWEGGGPPKGELRLWVGIGLDRVLTVETLAGLLAPYGDIPRRVVSQLEDDQERSTLQRLLGSRGRRI